MGEWKETALGEVLDFGNGKSRPMEDGAIPVYGGNGILGYTNRSNYSGKTIAIGRVGAYCGAVYFEDGPVWISDNALAAKAKAGNDSLFFYYLLKNADLNQHAGGSSHPLVTQTLLNSLEFSMCRDQNEQRAIASVLSSLDAKIDLLHRQNKTLEGMAETLFRQWFVEEAEEGWEEVELGRFVDCVNGVSYKSSELNPSKTALVTLKNFARDGGFRLDGFKEFDGAYKPQHEVFAGDLVVAHTDITQDASLIGNPVLVVPRAKYDKLVISMDLVKVVPKEAWCSKVFLYHLMRNSAFKEHAVGYSNGSTVLHLSKKAVPDFEFLLPPQEKVVRFTEMADGLHRKKNMNIGAIDTLTALRDTLLPKLMSGEVRVETN